MRVYVTLLLSSFFLMGTAVRAQSFEISSTLPEIGNAIQESLKVQLDTRAVQSDRDSNVLPERGSGR